MKTRKTHKHNLWGLEKLAARVVQLQFPAKKHMLIGEIQIVCTTKMTFSDFYHSTSGRSNFHISYRIAATSNVFIGIIASKVFSILGA